VGVCDADDPKDDVKLFLFVCLFCNVMVRWARWGVRGLVGSGGCCFFGWELNRSARVCEARRLSEACIRKWRSERAVELEVEAEVIYSQAAFGGSATMLVVWSWWYDDGYCTCWVCQYRTYASVCGIKWFADVPSDANMRTCTLGRQPKAGTSKYLTRKVGTRSDAAGGTTSPAPSSSKLYRILS
jgi:hypothetical protein